MFIGNVFFKGKSMKRCPSGFTNCKDVLGKKAVTCISSDDCNRRRKDAKKGKGESSGDKQLEERRSLEETTRKAQQEKVEQIQDFFDKLKQGLIIDPETGEVIQELNFDDPSTLLKMLKKIKGMYTKEVLSMVPNMPRLDEFLTILGSQSVAGRAEIGRGIMEHYFEGLGFDVKADQKDNGSSNTVSRQTSSDKRGL